MRVMSWDTTHAPAHWGSPDSGNPRAIKLPYPARPAELFSRQQLAAISRHLADADFLHLHGVWDPNLAQLGALARRSGKPYVISTRGMLDDWCVAQRALKKRAYLALVGRRWLSRAAAIHCTAAAELDQARKRFPPGGATGDQRAVVIPNLLDLSPYRDLPGPALARDRFPALRSGHPTLLFLSRISYKKGVEHLLRAARALHDRNNPVHVIIAGKAFFPEYLASLHALTRDLRLTDFVHFPGLVVGREKISLYQAADLLVLPTSQENFGFVFFEALAAGLPLVTTRGVDLWRELELSGGAAIESTDPNPLASTISAILADPARRASMSSAGRAWAFDFLNPDRLLDQFEALYAPA
jgi:glycosyltransferase involved in cell wall biosynthesis